MDCSKKSGYGVKITDLCHEDRERIANLIKTLAKATEEKEDVVKQLELERVSFMKQKSDMASHFKQLIKEKRAIKKSMDDCQKLINELQLMLSIQHKAESEKSLCTASVQTDKIPGDMSSTKKDCTKEANTKSFVDERHVMEAVLYRQESLLRQKQTLLQRKQDEFQKRFEYFACHGHFPEKVVTDEKTPTAPGCEKSKFVNSATSPLHSSQRKTPKPSPGKTHKSSVAEAKGKAPCGEMEELEEISNISALLASARDNSDSLYHQPRILNVRKKPAIKLNDDELLDEIFFADSSVNLLESEN